MTKKDYVCFADAIIACSRDIKNKHLDTPEAVLLNIWSRIADIFAKDNPNFSYTKFTDYINNKQ